MRAIVTAVIVVLGQISAYAFMVVYDPTACARMVEVIKSSYQTYNMLKTINCSLSSPSAIGMNLLRVAWSKLYWDGVLTGENEFFLPVKKDQRSLFVCMSKIEVESTDKCGGPPMVMIIIFE